MSQETIRPVLRCGRPGCPYVSEQDGRPYPSGGQGGGRGALPDPRGAAGLVLAREQTWEQEEARL